MNRDELIAELKKMPNVEVRFKFVEAYCFTRFERIVTVQSAKLDCDEEVPVEEDKDINTIVLG